MNSKNIIAVIILFSMAIYGCKEEEEFDIELIPGDYVGDLRYWNSWGETWSTFDNTDFPNRKEIILSVKKIGLNYILSFEKSFIKNFPEIPEIPEIPDLNIEITPTKSSNIYVITILPGQAYNSLIKEYTYNNLPSNYFDTSIPANKVLCDLTLKSNERDTIHFLHMTIHKID